MSKTLEKLTALDKGNDIVRLKRELATMTEAKNKAIGTLKELCDWYQDTHGEPMWQRARQLIAELEEVK